MGISILRIKEAKERTLTLETRFKEEKRRSGCETSLGPSSLITTADRCLVGRQVEPGSSAARELVLRHRHKTVQQWHAHIGWTCTPARSSTVAVPSPTGRHGRMQLSLAIGWPSTLWWGEDQLFHSLRIWNLSFWYFRSYFCDFSISRFRCKIHGICWELLMLRTFWAILIWSHSKGFGSNLCSIWNCLPCVLPQIYELYLVFF